MVGRRVREENKGLTIVAKPGFQILVFVMIVCVVTALMVGINMVIAASG